MQFEFATSGRIIFGSGKLSSIGSLVTGFGHRVLIISGVPQPTIDRLCGLLQQSGISYSTAKVNHEPTVDDVRDVLSLARETSIDGVIGIGGGSAIDLSKAVSALLSNPGDISDYLEVIGSNKSLLYPSLPLIAIPTTSGTGSEVTRNAVIGSPSDHVKVSLRSPFLLPRVTLVDPQLTLTLNPSRTAITGLDALTQLIEPYTCIDPNPLTDVICKEGIRRIATSIYTAFDQGDDLAAREDMSLAALFSGMALANSRLGAVHGLVGPVGGEISAPHGAICAALLPHAMSVNISALQNRSPGHPALDRYEEISRLLSGDPGVSVESGVRWVQDFCAHANIQPLSTYGLSDALFPRIIEKAYTASSMKGNPLILSEVELRTILQMSL
jgi:alcohol dehydrogenase class IV